MRSVLNQASKSKFARSVLLLTSGTLISRIIVFTTIPILTRVYTAADFGVYELFLSLNSFMFLFATFGYEMAILDTQSDNESIGIIYLCFILAATISLAAFVIIFYFRAPILQVLNASVLYDISLLLPVSMFLAAAMEIMNYWAIRVGFFRIIAIGQVVNTLVQVPCQILLGTRSTGSVGLVTGLVLGQISFLCVYFILLVPQQRKYLVWKSLPYLLSLLISKWRFPIFMFPATLLSTLSTQIPTFTLNYMFGTTTVGYYGIAKRILSVPAQLIGTSIRDVFRQRYRTENSVSKRVELIERSVIYFFAMSAIPMFLLFIIAPFMFVTIFGAKWYLGGIYAQILIPYSLFRFVCAPISSSLLFGNRQSFYLNWQIGNSIALVIGMLLSIFFVDSAITVLIIYSAIASISYAVLLEISMRAANTSIIHLWVRVRTMAFHGK